MREYLPSRKVIAAVLMAVVTTAALVAGGEASAETVTAVWLPVATAYAARG